jgi:outer membrane protein insertion porin family
MKYQLEYIEQYNASESKDEGIFRIGSLIPSLTYDFRDNPTIPKKGGLITLSIESANPAFLASDDLNFVRVLSRNRFYFPVTKNLVLAFSFSTGVIKNLNKIDGYVPQIKVFRLNGADVVRGFADNEINRLESGKDISEEVITDRAYFSNIKIEPRFNISDTSQIGVFYDGGRVFLNEYRPFDLKSAVGISFKYLTPVGSIDFDYGIKIKNSELLDGTQEEIGRFHLSIGYF